MTSSIEYSEFGTEAGDQLDRVLGVRLEGGAHLGSELRVPPSEVVTTFAEDSELALLAGRDLLSELRVQLEGAEALRGESRSLAAGQARLQWRWSRQPGLARWLLPSRLERSKVSVSSAGFGRSGSRDHAK